MRFQLPKPVLDRLRSLTSQGSSDDVTSGEDAFLLDPGLGPAMYLTSDGRVLRDGRGWDDQPLREATPDEAITALVTGAEKTGIAALLDLIPPPPPGAQPCPRCAGARRMDLLGADGEPHSIVCAACSGRGWAA